MDLLSTIIRLRARQSAQNIGFLGRHVQAWFLREVGRHSPEMAEQLHQEPDEQTVSSIYRPYTLSTLMKGEYPARNIRSGEWCCIRITSLTNELSELLAERVLPNLLPINRIGPVELDVDCWSVGAPGRDHFLTDTYSGLVRQAMLSAEKRIPLDFTSPTTFKQQSSSRRFNKDYPLPAPDMVFGSYLNHWSAFSGAIIEPEFGEFIDECLVLNELRIRSERVQISRKEPHRAAIGYVGQVRYAILGMKERSRFGPNWEHYSNIVRMLGNYAFYCGTGRHTTIGLGQTRPLTLM